MIIGIDASNIRAGGGITHLRELLQAVDPRQHGVDRIIVWGGAQVLREVPGNGAIERVHEPDLDRSLPYRIWWQLTRLPRLVSGTCDLLYVPGGTYLGRFRPFVTMLRNLLPFASAERRRYGASATFARLVLLRLTQARTLKRANGVIFLSDFSRRFVLDQVETDARVAVIPHGVARRFVQEPRPPQRIETHTADDPMRLLYVSRIEPYKHQWHVATAVTALRRRGFPVALDLVGDAYAPALRRLQQTLEREDPDRSVVRCHGPVPYAELERAYHRAALFVYASSCETFGQTVLEAMAAGLPVACAKEGAPAEILAEPTGFDPEDPASIAERLEMLVRDPGARGELAERGFRRAQQFSWARCARETFEFLTQRAR